MAQPKSKQKTSQQLNKLGIEGIYLNIIKAIHDKLTADIILNGEKLKVFPLRSGKKQGCSLFTTFIQHITRSTRQSN